MPDEDKQHIKSEHMVTGGGGLKEKAQLSWTRMGILVAVIALVGGFFVWNSFAATVGVTETTRLYQQLLGRSPGSAELKAWADRIDGKTWTVAQVEAQIKASNEYKNRQAAAPASSSSTSSSSSTTSKNDSSGYNPPTESDGRPITTPQTTADSEAYIKAVFLELLGRSASYNDVAFWGKRIDSGKTKDQVKAEIAATSEAKTYAAKKAAASTAAASNSKSCEVTSRRDANGNNSLTLTSDTVQSVFSEAGVTVKVGSAEYNDIYNKIASCQLTRAQAVEALKNSPAGQTAAKLQADLRAASMELLEERLQAQGGFKEPTDPGIVRYKWCQKYYDEYKASNGRITSIPDYCFEAVGLPSPAPLIDRVTHSVKLGTMTEQEAVSAVKDNAVYVCGGPFDFSVPACSGGSKYVAGPSTALDDRVSRSGLPEVQAAWQQAIGLQTPSEATVNATPTNTDRSQASATSTKSSRATKIANQTPAVTEEAKAATVCGNKACYDIPLSSSANTTAGTASTVYIRVRDITSAPVTNDGNVLVASQVRLTTVGTLDGATLSRTQGGGGVTQTTAAGKMTEATKGNGWVGWTFKADKLWGASAYLTLPSGYTGAGSSCSGKPETDVATFNLRRLALGPAYGSRPLISTQGNPGDVAYCEFAVKGPTQSTSSTPLPSNRSYTSEPALAISEGDLYSSNSVPNGDFSSQSASSTVASNPQSTQSCVASNAPSLRIGDKGVCVTAAQAYLAMAGATKSSGFSEEYTKDTAAEVKAYQAEEGLPQTGQVDNKTITKLQESAREGLQSKKIASRKESITAASTASNLRATSAIVYPGCDSQKTLKAGMKDDCVKRVQQILAVTQDPYLSISGRLDGETKAEVKRFQENRGLVGTGVVDKPTWNLLEAAKNIGLYNSPFSAPSGSLNNNR